MNGKSSVRKDKGADSSFLIKPPAIGLWLFICVISVLYEKAGIGFFAGFVFLLALSSYLWARASLKNVIFELKIDRLGMFPGQSFSIKRVIRNQKALPMLWAEIREPCNADDCAAPKADVIVGTEVFADSEKGSEMIYERLYTISFIKWRQSVGFTDEWEAKRRGIIEIDSSLVRSGDGFGLGAEGRRFTFPRPCRIVVYPALAWVTAADILNDMWDTRSETDGYLKDRTVIKSVRDYLPGDAARDLNMRLLARGQSLKTNVFETVTPDSVLFVLDAGSFRNSSSDVFERALSVLASLIEQLIKHGIHTALMAPESKWFPETCTTPSLLERDKLFMFELLAGASQDDAAFTGKTVCSAGDPGRVYIVCSDTERMTASTGIFHGFEHRVICLAADEAGSGGEIRTRRLFDFERAV